LCQRPGRWRVGRRRGRGPRLTAPAPAPSPAAAGPAWHRHHPRHRGRGPGPGGGFGGRLGAFARGRSGGRRGCRGRGVAAGQVGTHAMPTGPLPACAWAGVCGRRGSESGGGAGAVCGIGRRRLGPRGPRGPRGLLAGGFGVRARGVGERGCAGAFGSKAAHCIHGRTSASTKCRHAAYPLTTPGKTLAVTVAPTTIAAPAGVAPARTEFYDLISRSIVSMAVSIFSNDFSARLLAST
jgi:hypothetical protein